MANDESILDCLFRFWDRMSQGLSGRTLRKMPFLAYSLAAHSTAPGELSPASFLDAMERTIQKQFDDRQLMAAAT